MRRKVIEIVIILFAIFLVTSTHSNVIVGNSMEPGLYHGDIVFTKSANYLGLGIQEFNPERDVNVGDIVVYNPAWYDSPVIGRVINQEIINGTTYYTIKGDNNKLVDPYLVPPDRITDKASTIGNNLVVLPKIGSISLWFRGL